MLHHALSEFWTSATSFSHNLKTFYVSNTSKWFNLLYFHKMLPYKDQDSTHVLVIGARVQMREINYILIMRKKLQGWTI